MPPNSTDVRRPHSDPNQVASGAEYRGGHPIRRRGFAVAARVVMGEDHRGRVGVEGGHEHVARLAPRSVERAAGDLGIPNHPVAGGQEERDGALGVRTADEAAGDDRGMHHARDGDARGVLRSTVVNDREAVALDDDAERAGPFAAVVGLVMRWVLGGGSSTHPASRDRGALQDRSPRRAIEPCAE